MGLDINVPGMSDPSIGFLASSVTGRSLTAMHIQQDAFWKLDAIRGIRRAQNSE